MWGPTGRWGAPVGSVRVDPRPLVGRWGSLPWRPVTRGSACAGVFSFLGFSPFSSPPPWPWGPLGSTQGLLSSGQNLPREPPALAHGPLHHAGEACVRYTERRRVGSHHLPWRVHLVGRRQPGQLHWTLNGLGWSCQCRTLAISCRALRGVTDPVPAWRLDVSGCGVAI